MNLTRRAFFSTVAAVAVVPTLRIEAATPTFDSWPKGSSPQEIGTREAERFIASPYANFGKPGRPGSITYPETCAWYGALTFAQLTRQKKLTRELVARFDPFA